MGTGTLRLLAAFAIPALLAIAAGCGGEDEPAPTSTAAATASPETPEGAVEGFITALSRGDAGDACALLGAETLHDLEVAGSCESVLGEGLDLISEQQVRFPDYEITDLAVDGDTAEATLSSAETKEVIGLVREGGEWKLEGTTTLDQIHPASPLTSGEGEGEVGG